MDLPSDISLADLPAVRPSLLRLLDAGPDPVRIGTDALRGVSLPVVQLLFAAHLSARARGKRLEIPCPPGGALAQALTRLGFDAATDLRPLIVADVWVGLTAV